MVTPFGVTPGWLRVYLDLAASGMEDREARRKADESAGIRGKGFAGMKIAAAGSSARGDNSLILKVPVEGGASVLKNAENEPLLSEHGKWRREHIGALQASYGKTPYYEHLMPEIKAVYDDSVGITLERFNSRLLDVALNWIDVDCLKENAARLQKVMEETKNAINRDLSIFDALFRLGKRTSFGLLNN